MTGFQIAFMLLGALAVLSISQWARFAGAYHTLNDMYQAGIRSKESQIDSLRNEIAFWRAHFDKESQEHANDNS